MSRHIAKDCSHILQVPCLVSMIFILSVQDTGVGKSSIVWRFVEDSFDPNINPTIGYVLLSSTSTEVLFFPSPSFVVVLQVVMMPIRVIS